MINKCKKTWGVISAVTAVSLCAALPLLADDYKEQKAGKEMTAKSFVDEAMQGNQAEVALAEVAVRKAQNPELKQFARQLQQDHMQANNQLRPIAQQLGVNLNQSLSQKTQDKLAKLEKLEGQEFDQEFAKHALKDHNKDIKKYTKAQGQLQNPQLEQYISQTLPKLRQHFQHGKQVAQTVGVDQSTIAEIEREMPEAVGGSEDEENIDKLPGTSKGAGAQQLKQGQEHEGHEHNY